MNRNQYYVLCVVYIGTSNVLKDNYEVMKHWYTIQHMYIVINDLKNYLNKIYQKPIVSCRPILLSFYLCIFKSILGRYILKNFIYFKIKIISNAFINKLHVQNKLSALVTFQL